MRVGSATLSVVNMFSVFICQKKKKEFVINVFFKL